MSDENFQDQLPSPKRNESTAVTDVDPQLPRSRPVEDFGEVPSIKNSWFMRWERTIYFCVIAASPLMLTIFFLLRSGRDFTIPFLVGELVVLFLGIALIKLAIVSRNMKRAAVGLLCILCSVGFGFLGSMCMLWAGNQEVPFTLQVTDAKTGKPIPDAMMTFGEKEGEVVMQTDRTGVIAFKHRLFSCGATSLVCDQGGVSFHRVNIRISAAGYEEFEQPLQQVAGFGWNLHDPPPPTLRIKLAPNR